MSQHIIVEFGNVESDQFYSGRDPSQLDEEFQEQVIEELGEECDVQKVYSESATPPYVVFRASFEKSVSELYEKFGPHGLGDTVAEVAKEVYDCEVTNSRVEGW